MTAGDPLTLPDRLHDLEAVAFRHVEVEHQHVEIIGRGNRAGGSLAVDPEQGQGLSAILRKSDVVT
jgi:hypothetical protein